jgi:NAD(P)-dependent dehydrogenase (short-subunit alcohol dehydrogenase family)
VTEQIHVQGKCALVTGGSRGIGLGIARALARGGAKVAIVARKPEGLAEAKKALASEGLEVTTFEGHVGRTEDIERLVGQVTDSLGAIDVLVNNAATNPHFGPLMTADDKLFDKTFETNARGYFAMTRAVVRRLVDRGAPGSIINVASIQGLTASPLMGIYGMTKAAVISMTKTLAVELGPSKIRVNALAPGVIDTRFATALTQNQDIIQRILERTPLGRYGQPEDIGAVALYLASDASSFVTGQTWTLDGGYTTS